MSQCVKRFDMQYNRFRLLYTIAILYTTFSLLNAMLLKNPETFYRGAECRLSNYARALKSASPMFKIIFNLLGKLLKTY